ncbi:MotA/TolQ/ExbB proton channel family protein, partial [Caulobacter sp.]|uniref:MotA/TolQ/ExbB proton channel family protein n=1 Tax=Caulobacter sp. TaxID=78 RepID=UPI003BB12BC2
PYVRVAGGATGEAIAAAAVSPGSWTHLAVTAGDKITLYVNGVAAGSIDAKLPALGGEDAIGAAGGLPSFIGDLDEVGRANTARSASAIALAAQSQGRSAVFTAFSPEAESTKGGEGGYFGILLKALTPDAWAVIIILCVMAALSWVVMIGKGLFLVRTASANRDFLDDFSEAMARQGAHDGLARLDIDRHADTSSLARLFHIGRRELQVRLTENGAAGRGATSFALAPQSIAAIRSALDAGQARESQKLNSSMVLLTIAISGGPFIGLLGTVLGVMITFAAVAAAGDVNINAIAPGIAAALLATVAGLTVAIPALFGYNYLLSRSDEIGVEQQIFVDELEKRIAETYRGAPLPLAAE